MRPGTTREEDEVHLDASPLEASCIDHITAARPDQFSSNSLLDSLHQPTNGVYVAGRRVLCTRGYASDDEEGGAAKEQSSLLASLRGRDRCAFLPITMRTEVADVLCSELCEYAAHLCISSLYSGKIED